MKYKEVMATKDRDQWIKAVDKEHDRFTNMKIGEAIERKNVPEAAKVLTSTWTMKKKANGTFRARLNARGYEQVDGIHFDKDDIASPVTNDVTIRIVFVLMLMAG